MDGKPLVSSKIAWWNIIMIILQCADSLAGTGIIKEPYGAAVQGIVTILLRLYTSCQPINGIVTKQ